jgi:signal transduction histidine kinase
MTDTHQYDILLVEDNASDARLIEEYLKEPGWSGQETEPTVRHADRLAEAVETRDDAVDVVLLDLGLPDSSGFETLDAMLEATGDEPVVVLTGLDDDRVGVEAVERGAQDFLVKGDIDPKLLQRTLKYAVERERQQQVLERRNEELALLNQIVRHDIKNDLTVILGWGHALREHVEPSGKEHLDRIMSASDHIAGIAETAGDFMEILEGDREPELHSIGLGPVLRSEIEKTRSAHAAATITLSDDIPAGLTVSATDLLSSVFRNLLNNAVTHNDKSDPAITVEIETGPDMVDVHIIDNGPGIPDSQQAEIFGRGETGSKSQGSGIGLYLVDTLVGMYDGTVTIEDRDAWLDDPAADGSVFTVTLHRA